MYWLSLFLYLCTIVIGIIAIISAIVNFSKKKEKEENNIKYRYTSSVVTFGASGFIYENNPLVKKMLKKELNLD